MDTEILDLRGKTWHEYHIAWWTRRGSDPQFWGVEPQRFNRLTYAPTKIILSQIRLVAQFRILPQAQPIQKCLGLGV